MVPDYDKSPQELVNYGSTVLYTIYDEDGDRDGMPDVWELKYGTDLLPAVDLDGDGRDNLSEWLGHTNPTLLDTDGDGTDDPLDNEPLNPAVQ